LSFGLCERRFDDVSVIQWRKHKAYRTGHVLGVQVAMVSANADGWLATYWGDMPGYRSEAATADERRRTLVGTFLKADLAVAAVEERHLGREACG
jgi:hypothetical protein